MEFLRVVLVKIGKTPHRLHFSSDSCARDIEMTLARHTSCFLSPILARLEKWAPAILAHPENGPRRFLHKLMHKGSIDGTILYHCTQVIRNHLFTKWQF